MIHPTTPRQTPHPANPCQGCTPIHLSNGRHSGCWRHDALLLRMFRQEHILRRPPGLAFNSDLWTGVRPGLETIMAVDDAGPVWAIDVAQADKIAMPISRGFGPQVALPFRYWRRLDQPSEGADDSQLVLWEDEAA